MGLLICSSRRAPALQYTRSADDLGAGDTRCAALEVRVNLFFVVGGSEIFARRLDLIHNEARAMVRSSHAAPAMSFVRVSFHGEAVWLPTGSDEPGRRARAVPKGQLPLLLRLSVHRANQGLCSVVCMRAEKL